MDTLAKPSQNLSPHENDEAQKIRHEKFPLTRHSKTINHFVSLAPHELPESQKVNLLQYFSAHTRDKEERDEDRFFLL